MMCPGQPHTLSFSSGKNAERMVSGMFLLNAKNARDRATMA